MEPVEYLRAIRRYWLVVAASVVVALTAALVTRSVGSGDEASPARSYEASALLLLSSQNPGFAAAVPVQPPETVAKFVRLDEVVEAAADELEYEGPPGELAAGVRAAADPQSGLLTVIATSPSAPRAEAMMNAFVDALFGFLADVRAESARPLIAGFNRQINRLTESDPESQLLPTLRSQVESLHAVKNDPGYLDLSRGKAVPAETVGFQAPGSFAVRAAIALVLGLALGATIAIVLARTDTRIRSRRVAEESFGLPVLGEIPVIRRRRRRVLVSAAAPSSAPAEAFRLLGTEIVRWPTLNGDGPRPRERGNERPYQTLMVTSPGPGEGKTTVTANLAMALVEMGKRVLVLSCDFRHPEIHRFFGVPNSEGLCDALRSENGTPLLAQCTRETQYDRVQVVPSGPPEEKPGELLSSNNMRRALSEARTAADVVLLDSAPILAVSDSAHLLPEVDAVLIVARVGKTKTDIAARTTELLHRMNAPVLGVVLNAADNILLPPGYRTYLRRADEGVSAEKGEKMGDFPPFHVSGEGDNV